MSGRVNDFSTWRYIIRAGPGEFRPVQEPLSEPAEAFFTFPWALQTDLGSHSDVQEFLGSILEHFRIPTGGPGSRKTS